MPKRLDQKLMLSLTIIVILIGCVTGLINAKAEERQLLNNMILGADQLSRAITSATWQAMLADHRQGAYDIMQTIAHKQGIDRISIFNREGRVMFSSDPGIQNKLVEKTSASCLPCHSSQQPRVMVDARSRTRIFDRPGGGRSLVMVTPIYNEPACSQAACHAHPAAMKVLGVLDVALNLDPVDRELESIQYRVFFGTAVQVLLISVIIFFFTRHFVSVPIRKLISGTKTVSAMQLDQPIDIIRSSEELEELAKAFDGMRERLRLAITEINEFTHKLESKVETRTQELKATQDKLIQSDRLASLGQLAASVAHEINNPVAGVLNLSMLLNRILTDDGVPPGRVEEFRKYLNQIVNETSRVGRIVSDLLSFSRRSTPYRTKADLNKIVNTTISLVAHKLDLMNVTVGLALDKDLPPVFGDSSQIQQVVLNLLLNGAEATRGKSGGRVTIATQEAEDGSSVRLVVQDNGEGIPRENLKKIFDPFFTTKEQSKGVGLGLAVLYGIVEAHGGDIKVDSTVGEGATFTISFPLSPAGGTADEDKRAAEAAKNA